MRDNRIVRIAALVVGVLWAAITILSMANTIRMEYHLVQLGSYNPPGTFFVLWLFAFPGAWIANWGWARSNVLMKAYMLSTLAVYAVVLVWSLTLIAIMPRWVAPYGAIPMPTAVAAFVLWRLYRGRRKAVDGV